MPQIFEIEDQSKYHITISGLDNLEDAGEDFITKEELTEMGITQHYGGTRHFDSKIKTALNQVLASIKPGKKSAIIKDEDLLDMMKTTYYPASHWIKNVRRVGNRLFKGSAKKEQAVPSFSNWKSLVYACNQFLCNEYSVDMNINPGKSDRSDTINMYRTLLDWERDLKDWFDEGSCYIEEDVKWYKMMWEDSETIPQIKSSK
jgi:hypothetical protein